MNMLTKTLPWMAAMSLAVGCVGGDDTDTGAGTDDGTADDNMTMTTASTMMTTMVADDTMDDTGTADGTGDSTVGPEDTGTDSEGSSSSGPDPTIPEFNDTPFEDYVQYDRKGFPAINTGLNLAGDKDAYNASNPAFDATGGAAGAPGWQPDIELSLNILHRGVPGMQTANNTGLDDDLTGLGLDVCTPPQLAADFCIIQAGPFAIPDTLNIDTAEVAGFPNGRPLDATVMDIILAVLLLDLGEHGLGTFTDLDGDGTPGPSLNPLANDLAFPGEWPYLAAPHE